MLRKVRFLNLVVTLGLVVGLFAAAIGTASADPGDPGYGTIYFPWVPNGDDADGSGPWYGTVTVQNTEIQPIRVDLKLADGTTLASNVLLNPRASKTWTAAALGVPAPGAGVVVTAKWDPSVVGTELIVAGLCYYDTLDFTRSSTDGVVTDRLNVSPTPSSVSSVFAGGVTYVEGVDYTASITSGSVAITWLSNGARPAAGTPYDVGVYYCPQPRIAGVEKHATPSIGGNATTNSSVASVDGYTAVSSVDAGLANTGGATLNGQSRWVQPIVQTNSGWNTILYVTNVSGKNNVGVTGTFYAESGQGYAGDSTMILNQTLGNGETAIVDLTNDAGFPADVVGSVWIDADANVVAQVYRVKAETGMALTNVAQPRHDSDLFTTQYAPLVFRDYNGWNTGLNIANLSSADNRVTITYYNYAGNVVAVESKTIPARAMEVVYRPSTANSDAAEGAITSAIISGTHPLAASVDEVKYLSGTGQGQAMSYLAQRAIAAAPTFPGDYMDAPGREYYFAMLALPLVQKGNAQTGTGDTSGINLFNPDQNYGVDAHVQFLDTAGVPVAPTVGANDSEQAFVVPMGALSGATIYTLNYSELPAGFVGSAVVGAVFNITNQPSPAPVFPGSLVGVSNNVNYDVEFDGSSVFNMALFHGGAG